MGKIIRRASAWIVDRRIRSINKKMSKLRKELIRIYADDLSLVGKNLIALSNKKFVNRRGYEEKDKKIISLNKELLRYQKKHWQLINRYFELIGKPLRKTNVLKVI